MANIAELEGRISAALDRIAWSIENKSNFSAPAAPLPVGDDNELAEELAIERATNAKLAATNAEHVSRLERLEIRIGRLSERLKAAATENSRLENVVTELSQQNTKLREAQAGLDGADNDTAVADLTSELEHFKSSREQDLAELDAIIEELTPLMTKG